MKWSLCLFAFTFPLYGSNAFFVYSHVFEFIITLITFIIIITNTRIRDSQTINVQLRNYIALYIILACTSLLLLPAAYLYGTLVLWGFRDFSSAVFFAIPNSIFYPLAGVNRLILFFILIYQLAKRSDAKNLYRQIFVSMLIGAVFAAVAGILDQYNIFILDWYRIKSSSARLQSFFLNPNWHAEYISVATPFILMGFVKRQRGIIWIGSLLAILIICEISILLTGSRTGWVAYPLVLVICWLFFYLSKKLEKDNSHLSWKAFLSVFIKTLVSVPITILISFFLIFQVIDNPHIFENLTNIVNREQSAVSISEEKTSIKSPNKHSQYIKARLSKITSPSTRAKLLRESRYLIEESPFFGLGYETYRWHTSILGRIPESDFAKNRLTTSGFDTPHNIFAQILISNGVVGLILWLSILGYISLICLWEFKKNNNYLAICVILSAISVHVYGLAQSMQYIPVIWFVLFLNIGYCLTLEKNLLSPRMRKISNGWLIILTAAVVLGCLTYLYDNSSSNLASKYNRKIYALDQKRNDLPGFYHQENWKEGAFRWTGRRAVINLRKSGLIELTVFCGHPRVESRPVSLSIYLNDELINQDMFFSNSFITKQFYLPSSKKKFNELLFEVSQTFSPLIEGINTDSRKLGVAVGEIKYINELATDRIGFHDLESWRGASIANWPKQVPQKFRWTDLQATMKVDESSRKNGISLFLMAAHPDLRSRGRVKLKIMVEEKIIVEVDVSSMWQKIEIPANLLHSANLLTFRVDRVWNPHALGISEDRRNLGVAVASPYWNSLYEK